MESSNHTHRALRDDSDDADSVAENEPWNEHDAPDSVRDEGPDDDDSSTVAASILDDIEDDEYSVFAADDDIDVLRERIKQQRKRIRSIEKKRRDLIIENRKLGDDNHQKSAKIRQLEDSLVQYPSTPREQEPWAHKLRSLLHIGENEGMNRWSHTDSTGVYRACCRQENMGQTLVTVHPNFSIRSKQYSPQQLRTKLWKARYPCFRP
ncbi:hypothetical protein F5Y15DRAFT_128880 [Xylariaceae sp. FL0016]|nr:hypothetical protein F5Y15DRAFT_128880 [Xylariaceae sp. FL0016]